MKLGAAAFLLLSHSGVFADQCTDKCNNIFSRSITQVLTSCVEACEDGGQVCDDFCDQYVSDTEPCKAIFCQGRDVEEKTSLRSGTESLSGQDADLGILGSRDVSFVQDAAGRDSFECFDSCPTNNDIYGYFYCIYKCFYSRDNKDVSLTKTEVAERPPLIVCADGCRERYPTRNDIYVYFDCIDECFDSYNNKDVSLVKTGLNYYGYYGYYGFPCFRKCAGYVGQDQVFGCLDRCYGVGDENKFSMILNKVEVKEEESEFMPACGRQCRRGNGYDRDCVASCYGFPSYCHYSCFDETNSDVSYRQCVKSSCRSNEVGRDHLISFAKKMSKHP